MAMDEPERWVFCEACGAAIGMPRIKRIHLLCAACSVQPRQWTNNPHGHPATLRELFGLRDEPRSRMIGENWK